MRLQRKPAEVPSASLTPQALQTLFLCLPRSLAVQPLPDVPPSVQLPVPGPTLAPQPATQLAEALLVKPSPPECWLPEQQIPRLPPQRDCASRLSPRDPAEPHSRREFPQR